MTANCSDEERKEKGVLVEENVEMRFLQEVSDRHVLVIVGITEPGHKKMESTLLLSLI